MIHVVAVDAAHWWGFVGWLYRNTPGNLAASGIAFVCGWLAGRGPWKRHRASQAELHRKLDALHVHLGVGQ